MGQLSNTKALGQALGDYVLPAFPTAAMRALERIRDEDAPATSVVECLAIDPGLSLRVLSTVNSAAYAPRRLVGDLPQAVAMLGRSNLESLVLAAAAGAALPRPRCRGFDAARFWRAAARRAAVGRLLAERLHPATRSETFTASLLQDLALPVLAAGRPAEYGPVLEAWVGGNGRLRDLERMALGFDHEQMGCWLATNWQLPTSLCTAIRGHHQPRGSVDGCPPAVSLVAMLGEDDDRAGIDELIADVRDGYGLDPDEVVELVDAGFRAADQLAQLMT